MDKVRKSIVITSIFEPTEAVKAFSEIDNCNLIVVGDKKTPQNWHCENAEFLSVKTQEDLGFELSKILPYNHYCRKMIGYLKAIKDGANYIIDTDDDNIPKDNWAFPEFNGNYNLIKGEGFINIYQYYTDQQIWPRGLPLDLISKKYNIEDLVSRRNSNVGIWQGLADEDPDVDAIYRLTSNKVCTFEEKEPVVLDIGTISPFNTQNTIITKELFTLMYLPTYVTFRFTDILRGLIAQPIMWLYGYHLGFTNATVIQKRNPHDYMADFISEIPMYKNCEKVVGLVSSSISKRNSIGTNLYQAYESLLEEDIVKKEEMATLEAWLEDVDHGDIQTSGQ